MMSPAHFYWCELNRISLLPNRFVYYTCMASCSESSCAGRGGLSVIRERSKLATSLLLQAQQLRLEKNVRGVQRLERKIKAEKLFLESIMSGQTALRDHHLSSSNLTHLQSVLQVAQGTLGLVAVQQSFTLVPSVGLTPASVLVDVVGGGGGRWVRVFARKRSALHCKWLGEGHFGDKSVGEVAGEYVEASRQNPHKFQPPRVSFVFCDGITESISRMLEGSGVEVVGPVYPDQSTQQAPSLHHVVSLLSQGAGSSSSSSGGGGGGGGTLSEPQCSPSSSSQGATTTECERVNLDVSSMLAWVSSLTHGGENCTFADTILAEQAEQERRNPLWPQLQAATKGKKLVACRSAVDSLSSIVETVGGDKEKARARNLLAMVEVVEDCPSVRAMALPTSGRIKHRAKVVFGSGDTLCATTLTANEGFVRAAAQQGVCFEVIVHPSRALTEAKQMPPAT